MNTLAWEVRFRSEFAPLKQRAWEAAEAAVTGIRVEGSYGEMETAAIQADSRWSGTRTICKPARECFRGSMFPVRHRNSRRTPRAPFNALAALPIGATQKQLDAAKQAALVPFEEAVANREKAARLEAEKQRKSRDAQFKVDGELAHIEAYLKKEYEFDSYFEIGRAETGSAR